MEFTIAAADGEKTRYELLFTYECDENGKKYLVYTDHSRDETGTLQVFASVLRSRDDGQYLEPPETEPEWQRLEEILQYMQEGRLDEL